MSNLDRIGVTEDGRIKYIDISSLIMDEAGGIVGDIIYRATYAGGKLASFRTIYNNLSDSDRRKYTGWFIRDEAQETAKYWFNKLNNNVAAQVDVSRYAVEVDVIPMPKARSRKSKIKMIKKKKI